MNVVEDCSNNTVNFVKSGKEPPDALIQAIPFIENVGTVDIGMNTRKNCAQPLAKHA